MPHTPRIDLCRSLLLLLPLLASCTPVTKLITFTTNPTGAEIIVNGKKLPDASPASAKVNQQHDLSVVAIKEGYELSSTTVPTTTSRWRAWLWTRHDPDTRYLDVDEVSLRLKPIPKLEEQPKPALPIDLPPFDPSVKIPLFSPDENVQLIKKEE